MKIQTTKNLIAQFIIKGVTQPLFVIVALVCVALVPAHAQGQVQAKAKTQYNVSTLPGLGGTSSGGNSINDQSWTAGYSRLPNRNRHATVWRNSLLSDLGTLGGPNSSVTWNVKNTAGIIVGISQTADPQLLGESWSSAAFYSTPNNVGYINLGFVWQNTSFPRQKLNAHRRADLRARARWRQRARLLIHLEHHHRIRALIRRQH